MQHNEKKENNNNNNKVKKKIKKAANLLGSLFKKEKKARKNELSTSNHFLELPTDLIIHQIVPELDSKTMLNLALVNKDLSRLFQSKVLTLEARLAHYIVVEPNDIEVRKILDKHPELVMKKIHKVKDNSKRTLINYTPLQLAYYAGDDTMCETLRPYIAQVCSSEEAGIEEMRNQIKEKVVEENKEKSEEQDNHLRALLAAVIQAILNEQFNHGRDSLILNDTTLKAIQAFKEAFDTTQPKVIDKGVHFRLETLQEVCKAYEDAARQWNYDYKKSALFEDGVLAHVLTYVTANIAQEFNQGLYYRQDRNEKFKRCNKTRDGHHFYRYLRGDSVDFQLPGSCVDIVFGYVCASARGAVLQGRCGVLLQNLCQTKASKLQNLCNHTLERKQHLGL